MRSEILGRFLDRFVLVTVYVGEGDTSHLDSRGREYPLNNRIIREPIPNILETDVSEVSHLVRVYFRLTGNPRERVIEIEPAPLLEGQTGQVTSRSTLVDPNLHKGSQRRPRGF